MPIAWNGAMTQYAARLHRHRDASRSTKDADFDWRLPEEAAIELVLDAAALDLGDRFTFALDEPTATAH